LDEYFDHTGYMTSAIVANIETRRSSVTDKRIAMFAEVFGVAVGDLFPLIPPAFKRQALAGKPNDSFV
jgi:hypothetical protein